jgi:hypothetical protein
MGWVYIMSGWAGGVVGVLVGLLGFMLVGRREFEVVGRLRFFAESHVSLALGREPSSPRVWLSAQNFFLKKY